MAYRFENLEIWHESVQYAKRIYEITEKFPRHELYGLTIQLRRAAVSISSNIAEGAASYSPKDFCNFLNYSIRSLSEVISQLFIAKALFYVSSKDFESLYHESEILIKKITKFKRSLNHTP